jgi:RimJ/RimL family protein N-acetyltransferase
MQPMTVPRVETERLLLREWSPSDLDAFSAMSADPEVMRYLGAVHDRAGSWRRMALHAGHWALRGYGNWVVERKADGVLIGRVGLWNPEGWPGLEVGWTLARHAWGQGYATEAASATMEWAWTVLDAPRLISVIHPENLASARVAERVGLRRLREETLHSESWPDGLTVVIFGIEQPGSSTAPAPS